MYNYLIQNNNLHCIPIMDIFHLILLCLLSFVTNRKLSLLFKLLSYVICLQVLLELFPELSPNIYPDVLVFFTVP